MRSQVVTVSCQSVKQGSLGLRQKKKKKKVGPELGLSNSCVCKNKNILYNS